MSEAATLTVDEIADLRDVVARAGGVKAARMILDGLSREAIERALAGLPQRVGTLHLIRARLAAFRAAQSPEQNEARPPDQERRASKEHEHAERSAS